MLSNVESESECSICLEQIMTNKEYHQMLLKDFPNRHPIYTKRREILKCGHLFHEGCLNKWYYDEFVDRLKIPLCPLCRCEIHPPPVKKSFPVLWLKNENKLYALDESAKNKKGCFIVGPYPCTGDIDYGHFQVQVNDINNLLYHGTELCDNLDTNFRDKHPNMILAL